ncbi:MAG: glucosaminidase domain-containing protein [Ktedonobacteraceae bacterium]
MASGSYARKSLPQEPIELEKRIPARATRELPPLGQEIEDDEDDFSDEESFTEPPQPTIQSRTTRTVPTPQSMQSRATRVIPTAQPMQSRTTRVIPTTQSMQPAYKTTPQGRAWRTEVDEYIPPAPPPLPRRIVNEYAPTPPSPLQRHQFWLRPWVVCVFCVVASLLVLISAGIFQRSDEQRLLNYGGGKTYDIQVGGKLASSWQTDQPLPPRVAIKSQSGPYGVLGKPTITPDFINQVLSRYNSPAAGKGQALYDLGVKYGIDPAFALAFFMHESTFGTRGEASASLSLGNIRCIPNFRCRDNFAWFDTWEDGFQEWYKLIRNLYVAQWGLTTVDQIIPTYAPAADHNNETAYINSLKHALDTWHAGQILVN